MKKNMGTVDRVLRFVLAVIIAILYFTNSINAIAAIIFGIIAIIFLLTSLIGVCPAYIPLKINTIGKKSK